MGTKVYGSQDNITDTAVFKPYFDYTPKTNNDTTYTLTLAAGIKLIDILGFQPTSISITLTATGKSNATGSKSFDTAYTDNKDYPIISSRDVSWTKTHTAQTITITAYHSSSKKASKSFTIPAKTSYTVTYNANGGANAPTSQTKWYGESLTLQKSVPSKIDSTSGLLYDFTGWNTKADGTGTMYQPGAAYTGNDKLTLCAQWEPHYYPPVIKHYDVTRCDQNGNPEDEGEYAKVTFDCVINRWKYSDNTTLSAASVSIGSHTATPTITYSTDGYDTVCTCSAIVGDGSFDTDATYSGSISVTDSSTGETMSTATTSIVLNTAKFAIDISANGRSIGIFKAASDTEDYLFDVGGKIKCNDYIGTPKSIFDIFYPVGSYYETSDSTFNPNTAWGGEWILETEGQVHVSAGSNFNVAGAISNTSDGGSTHLQQHTHGFTQPTVPKHDHGMTHTHSHNHQTSGWIQKKAANGSSHGIPCGISNDSKTGTYTSDTDATASNKSKTDEKPAVATTGGAVGNINNVTKGLAANSNLGNMPPFINVYRWHRVA